MHYWTKICALRNRIAYHDTSVLNATGTLVKENERLIHSFLRKYSSSLNNFAIRHRVLLFTYNHQLKRNLTNLSANTQNNLCFWNLKDINLFHVYITRGLLIVLWDCGNWTITLPLYLRVLLVDPLLFVTKNFIIIILRQSFWKALLVCDSKDFLFSLSLLGVVSCWVRTFMTTYLSSMHKNSSTKPQFLFLL